MMMMTNLEVTATKDLAITKSPVAISLAHPSDDQNDDNDDAADDDGDADDDDDADEFAVRRTVAALRQLMAALICS